MSEHLNAALHRRGHQAFNRGDMSFLAELFADDTVWHWPGKSQVSGVLNGRESVFEAFAKLNELTEGNIELEDLDFLASDERSVALSRVTASRDGRTLEYDMCEVVLWRDGQIAEEWIFLEDEYAFDEFWA